MTTDRFTLRAAVYLLLVKDGKVLLIRRFNTGWRDGDYTLPAGHVDGDAPAKLELCREAQEEIGITVQPDDLEFAHVIHHHSNHEYIEFFFTAKTWTGEPTNCEPDKCDDLQWFPIDQLPDNILPNVKKALAGYASGSPYSELGWA